MWPVYANDSLGPSAWPKNESEHCLDTMIDYIETDLLASEADFEITIPDLGSQCSTVGACAIQWWWYVWAPDPFEFSWNNSS